jgi:hypothetical protein
MATRKALAGAQHRLPADGALREMCFTTRLSTGTWDTPFLFFLRTIFTKVSKWEHHTIDALIGSVAASLRP